MHELIIRSLGGNATEAEEAQLRHWRASSSENEVLYQSLRRLWALTGVAAPEWEPAEPSIDRLIAMAEVAKEGW
jgi:ferric-dicitrate binding protein FerR (iron transport regulator)